MPDGLYERDALAWAERQADLLRRLAAGERVNEEVDWPNVIEEMQDVGLSELRACKSLLRQALAHLLKGPAAQPRLNGIARRSASGRIYGIASRLRCDKGSVSTRSTG